MQCISKSEAQRVAFFGFRKMTGLYAMMPSGVKNIHRVETVEGDRVYFVRVNDKHGRPDRCTCPFFKGNRDFKICKHIYFAKDVLALKATAKDAEAKRFEAFQDMTTPQESTEANCWIHGPHNTAENGEPLSFCDRCEAHR